MSDDELKYLIQISSTPKPVEQRGEIEERLGQLGEDEQNYQWTKFATASGNMDRHNRSRRCGK